MATSDKPKASEKKPSKGKRRGSKLGGLIKKLVIVVILVSAGWFGHRYYQANPKLKDKIISKLGLVKAEATDDPLLREAEQQKRAKEQMLDEQ